MKLATQKFIRRFFQSFKLQASSARGSVLIMTLIITSGILVIGMELSTIVMSTIRQARNLDRATFARYAAESAIENGLYQLRVERASTLRSTSETLLQSSIGTTEWSYAQADGLIDPTKFNTTIPLFSKSYAPRDTVMQFSLYTTDEEGTHAVSNIKTLRVTWEEQASCVDENQSPGIEMSILAWSGGAVDWSSASVQKVFIQPGEGDPAHIAEADLSAMVVESDPAKPALSTLPLLVRVKPYFCDVSGITISLPDPDDPAKTVAIPNYFLLNPTGKTGPITESLSAIVPAQSAIADIFDFALFSEEQIIK